MCRRGSRLTPAPASRLRPGEAREAGEQRRSIDE
jgi:hypothetical protein